jgi:hypothetical protein
MLVKKIELNSKETVHGYHTISGSYYLLGQFQNTLTNKMNYAIADEFTSEVFVIELSRREEFEEVWMGSL